MALIDGDARWRGCEMGAGNDKAIQWDALSGLVDLPRLGSDSPPPSRLRDTAMPGWADVGWRDVQAINAHANGDAAIAELSELMLDRHTVYPLAFRRDMLAEGVELCVYAVADRCEFGEDAQVYANRNYRPSLRWLAADPTIFTSTATTITRASGAAEHSLLFDNEGRWASPSGRAWTLTITASGGTATSPYVELADTGQRVTWQGLALTSGQTLSLDEYRASRIGALRVDGYVRTGTQVAPDWPIHEPGNNTFLVGAASGNVTCTLTCRSTW